MSAIRTFWSRLQPKGLGLPTPAFVFLTISLVGLAQIPPHFLIRAGFVSLGLLVSEAVSILGVVYLLMRIFSFDVKQILNFKKISFSNFVLIIAMTVGAVVVMDYLTAASEYFFPLPVWVKQAAMKMMVVGSSAEIVWKLFLLTVVPAFCEEIFFRGYCQTALAARWGNKIALLVVAFVFAVLHGNIWYLHLYFILGLFFGWVYIVAGSLWAPIACHILNNAWTFLCYVFDFHLPLKPVMRWENIFIVLIAASILWLSFPRRRETSR